MIVAWRILCGLFWHHVRIALLFGLFLGAVWGAYALGFRGVDPGTGRVLYEPPAWWAGR